MVLSHIYLDMLATASEIHDLPGDSSGGLYSLTIVGFK